MNTCPTPDRLRRLLAEELTSGEQAALEAHVDGCAACQEALERLTDTPLVFPPARPDSQAALAFLKQVQAAGPANGLTSPTAHSMETAGSSSESAPWPAVPGYDILGLLGRGGMGVVYKARHRRLQRLVALKMILAGAQIDAERSARFRTEAEAAARLQHPNIVQIFEVGEWQAGDGGLPVPYCALEYVDGTNLEKTLAGQPQPARQAARLVEVLARAIEAAHRAGIIHRDLKPANILLSGDGAPKITDFGLAKVLAGARGQAGLDPQTQSGAVMGTPSYIPPEQAAGRIHNIGAATDVYGLGAILYELVTGRPPFRGDSVLETLRQVETEEPVPPRRLQPRLPVDLETVCLKCLRKEPGQRYASAAELAEDLRRFQAHEPIRARRVGLLERGARWCRRKPAEAALAGFIAALLLVLAAGAGLLLREETERARAAERNAQDQLWRAHRDQARAARLGRQVGRRWDGLAALTEAARIATRLGVPEDQMLELRNEAIACLSVIDLRPRSYWEAPADYLGYADFDPALERYALGDTHSRLVVRRVADHQEVLSIALPWANAARCGCRFSPDGRLLVVWGGARNQNSRFVLWDLERRCQILDGASGTSHRAFAFSPDSRRFAVGLADGSLGLFDTQHGREVLRFGRNLRPDTIAFHPDGHRLAVASLSMPTVPVWDLDRREVVKAFSPPTGTLGLSWSPDGRLLAAGGTDGNVFVWDAIGSRPERALGGHAAFVDQLVFNHACTMLASGDFLHTTRLWDVTSGELLQAAPGMALRFDRDDRQLAFHDGRHLGCWEVSGGMELRALAPGAITVDFSPDGAWLATAGEGGVRLWDMADVHEVADLGLDHCETAAFRPDGSSLMTYGKVSGLRLWPIHRPPEGPGAPRSIGPPRLLWTTVRPGWAFPGDGPQHRWQRAGWSGDGRRVAVVDYRHEQALALDPDRPGERRSLGSFPDIGNIALSPDGRWVAAGTGTISNRWSRVRVWRLADGQMVYELPGHSDAAFSPDSQWLVTGGLEDFRSWRTGSWEPGWGLSRKHVGGPESAPLAFAADGRLLALARSAQSVQLVDPATARECATLSAPEPGAISCLRFNPDGTRLAVAHGIGRVHLWDLQAIGGQLAERGLHWQPWAGARPTRPIPHRVPLKVLQPPLDDSLQGWRKYWSQRGRVHQTLGQSDEVIVDFTEALKILPADTPPKDQAQLLWQRAQGYAGIRAYDAARTDLRQAVELAPGFAPACHDLARLYATGPERLRDLDAAFPLARKAAALEPNHATFGNTLGIVSYRLGWYEQAAATLETNLRRSQGAVAAADRFFLAMSYHQLRETTKARASYKEAMRWWREHRQAAKPPTAELQGFQQEAAALLHEPE